MPTEKILEGTDYVTHRVYPDSFYAELQNTVPHIDKKGPQWLVMKIYKERALKEGSLVVPALIREKNKPYFTKGHSLTVSSVNIPSVPKNGILPGDYAWTEICHRQLAIPYGFLDQENDDFPIRVEIYTNDVAQKISSVFSATYTGDKIAVEGADVIIPQNKQVSSTLHINANTAAFTENDMIYGFFRGNGFILLQSFMERQQPSGGNMAVGAHTVSGTPICTLSINGGKANIISPGDQVWKAFSDENVTKSVPPYIPPLRPFTISFEHTINSYVCWKWNSAKTIYEAICKWDAKYILGGGTIKG